jgi:hypothetical protein
VCKEEGITLIEIPYWWDGKKDSLNATIFKHIPHLANPSYATQTPIPLHKP